MKLTNHTVTTAWPIKPDDKKYWEDQVTVISDRDLDQFVTAATNGDKKVIVKLLTDLKKVVSDSQSNIKTFLPFIGTAVGSLGKLAEGKSWTFSLRMISLRFIVNAIDGNRDNKSYYLLDAARVWIEKRLSSAQGQLKTDLKDIQNMVVETRDTLESMAQVFVKGVKDLKELTKDAKTNEEKIKQTVSGMVGASKNAPLLGERYENTVEKIAAVIAATGSNTSVSPK